MNASTFAQAVKHARAERHITQQQLADQVGVALNTIQRIEGRKGDVGRFVAASVCKTLHLPSEVMMLP